MKRMSFSEEIKSELVNLEIDEKHFHHEIAGFIKARGKLIISKDGDRLSIVLSSPYTARRFRMLMNMEGERSEIFFSTISRLGRKSYMILVQIDDINDFLRKYGIHLDDPEYLPSMDVEAFRNFMRGMFLSAGSVNDPTKSYSLEISMMEGGSILDDIAEMLSKMLKINVGTSRSPVRSRLYIKSGKGIVKFLEFIGVVRGVIRYRSLMEQRKIKADVLRTVNFISANARRTGISSKKQVDAIRYIDRMVGIDSLPGDLREVAILRLKNMELSLRELADKLGLESKSVVQNKMNRILKIAEKLKKMEDGTNRGAGL